MNLFKTYFFVLIAGSLFLSCTLKRDNVLDINNNLQNGGLAILTTTAISSINKNNATSGGNITDSGATTIIARGVCWSINPAPTIAQNIKTSDGTGIGSFTSNITGLVSNTTYYVRAYATNTAGTGYGNQQTFVTNSGGVPMLTTYTVIAITSSTAVSGGIITSDSGSSVSARGVCWSTSANPTIADNHTSDGTGIGSFTSNITGLVSNTTYYVRAYATNTAGTGYGNQQTFVTYGSHAIGDTFGGGIIAYILQPRDPGYSATVQHGLIAAPTDQSTSIVWWNGTYVTTGATGLSIGTGMANTNAIIAAQGAGTYAASICRSLTLGGYSDWYLPSRDELNTLHMNKNLISGFAFAYYWSSSEYTIYDAWYEDFYYGYADYYTKVNSLNVRAVRAF